MARLALPLVACALFLASPVALAADAAAQLASAPASPTTDASPLVPPTPPPAMTPAGLPPPAAIPAPPATAEQPYAPSPAVASPAGQWTYTSQYGWLWMPYGQEYTYVNPTADVSDMYVYYPLFGWQWVYSPWVFGYGPAPYWGVHGRVGFAFYAHPWFHAGAAYRGAAYRGAAYRGATYHAPSRVRVGGGYAFQGGGGRGGGRGHR